MTEVRGPRGLVKLRDMAVRVTGQPGGQPATHVDGGYGTVRAAAAAVDVDEPVPVPARLSPREAERLMQAEMMQAVASLCESTTALAARLGGRTGATNGVLLVRLVALPAGRWSYAGPVAVGSVLITNHHATDPLYVASGDQGDVPVQGLGVQRVEAGATLSMPIGAHAFTIAGPVDAVASVQAFAGMQAYGIGGML
ncbi:hypothetical protein C5N14_30900 [Micromonospora sp. MW-13]|uniref:hypothetical protein n=1 Tax=Micromonospora sp. MW-13 TaxID=2094022 RepID=UPI000E442F1D|nr:hypothetical protein [Micromonospora sp. MW-13]RGC65002.1 hypothetical protein C5N14_30900 [Micromonospora sp. MW-13]